MFTAAMSKNDNHERFMTKLVLPRARAITSEVLYAAGIDDDADAAEPMTKSA